MDPETQLAFSVFSNPGVYAVMLGSGISRSARIPTGWEVVLDLARKVAAAEGADPGSDPVAWFQERYGTEPNYSTLLERLGKTPAERQQILRGYFEPADEEERSRGDKRPTKAHQAIAKLVARRYVSVILTTNFDRLMEQALEAVGVVPTVISSVDASRGALPLQHTKCTLVKVHGDYLDTRIRNTPAELEAYESETDALLDRIADEYGLIVCGWSAEYDPALCAAFLRAPNRRFTTFWAYRGPLGQRATAVIDHRQATKIEIASADDFFFHIEEKVAALEAVARPHPLTTQLAVASLKRYLGDQRRIDLRDLLTGETERVMAATSPDRMPLTLTRREADRNGFLGARIAAYEGEMLTLQAMYANLCFWGRDTEFPLITEVLERLGNPKKGSPYHEGLWRAALYPALLAFYAGGVAASAAPNWDVLIHMMTKPTIRHEKNYVLPSMPALKLVTAMVIVESDQKQLFGSFYVPLSEHLFAHLRESLRDVIPDDDKYSEAFDRFEYLLCLTFAHYANKYGTTVGLVGVPGRFGWNESRLTGIIAPVLKKEIQESGDEWPPLKAGIFDGSAQRLQSIMDAVDVRIQGTLY